MISINTNLGSLIVQSNLKKSTNALNTAIERMTTGFKINHAKDNAANYSINTKLNSQLSSYEVAQDNVMLGSTLIATASSSLSLITDHLQRMRDLSEQAANGTYGADSLTAIQSEIDARMSEINRVISNTEYNGITLFQGEEKVEVDETKRVVNQTSFQAGETYYLTGSDDLVQLQNLVNSGVDTTDVTFELASNIDMAGVEFRGIGDSNNSFEGTFDGKGHVISNLTINTTESYVGLFGNVASGSITSVGLENCNISGGDMVGGIVGRTGAKSTISICYVTGDVTGTDYVGGLVGYIYSSTISSSYATGDVTGTNYVGGLVGTGTGGTISLSYATGDVTGTSGVGGLCGSNAGDDISSSYATGNVTGTSEVGGLVGNVAATETIISTSYATGDVIGIGDYVGGLIGRTRGSSVTISASYATGSVEGETWVGGLVGVFGGNIESCYAAGSVKGDTQIGGLVGIHMKIQ